MGNKVNVSVLGCCVSREVLNYSNKFNVISTVYSSYISLFEERIPVTIEDCENCISPNFKARNAYLECNKKVFEYLAEKKAEYIILDFAEVVNDYYQIKVPYATSVKPTKIVADPNIRALLMYKKIEMERVSSRNCNIPQIIEKVFSELLKMYPVEKIILNQTTFASFYWDINGQKIEFQNHYRLDERNIKKVRDFEMQFAQYLPKRNIIPPLLDAVSHIEHKYGCSPIHYTDETSLQLVQRIENFFNNF